MATGQRTISLPGGRRIGDGQPAFIVAEIGQNHQGKVYPNAIELLRIAHECRVDAVKFCKRDIPSDVTAEEYNRPYCGPQSFGDTYGRHREYLELPPKEYSHIKRRMVYNEWDEVLFATACDVQSVNDLEAAIDPPLYKIASRDLDNHPLIDYVAGLGKPVILSCGMARDYYEVAAALEVVRKHHDLVVVLYCVSQYPAPDDVIWLPAIREIRQRFGVLVGFSDHTRGIHLAQAAVQMGACVIEKHITEHRDMPGSDHAGSLERPGLEKLVRNIRSVEHALRTECPDVDTTAARDKLGRSLTTVRPMATGEEFTESDVCLKSPGHGIHWPEREQIIGKRLRRPLEADVTILATDVEE